MSCLLLGEGTSALIWLGGNCLVMIDGRAKRNETRNNLQIANNNQQITPSHTTPTPHHTYLNLYTYPNPSLTQQTKLVTSPGTFFTLCVVM